MKKTVCAFLVAAALLPAGTTAVLASGGGSTGAAPLLTLDYAGADVTDVIRSLATQSGVNVALGPGVKGQVTVHMRGKTVDEALMVVANLAGLGAKKVGDTYVVAPRAEMRPTLERLGVTRQYAVRYLAPQAAAEMTQAAFPDVTARPQGKMVALIGAPEDLDAAEKLLLQNDMVSPDQAPAAERVTLRFRQADKTAPLLAKLTPGLSAEASGDAIVLAGTRAQVDAAKRSLAMIDVQGQPDTETRVYNIKYTPANQLIPILERAVPEVQVIAGPTSASPTRPTFNPISGKFVGMNLQQSGNNGQQGGTNGEPTTADGDKTLAQRNALTLILKGAPTVLDQAVEVLEKVDTAPRQMMIEAKVVETSPSTTEEYGLKWDWTRFGFYEAPAGTPVKTGSTAGGHGDFTDFVTRPLGFGALSRVPWSFQAVLSAMITDKKATLLANPQIAVLNDQDASIFIGDTLRFQALANSSATVGSTFTVVEVPVGIILLVHPRINDDGNVTLRVHPVVSTITGFTDGLPQTSAREAETIVRVKDGDTLVIGGLIRDEDIRSMSKIPLLGDLPLIGNLFRSTSRDHRRSEVMVVLTIKLIK